MRFLLGLALLMLPTGLAAQCSDAGACAAGRLSPSPMQRVSLSLVEAGSGNPDRLHFGTLRLDGQFHVGAETQVLLTVPLTRVSGPLGSTQGLGDVVVLLDQTLLRNGEGSLAVHAGARLDTGDANGDPALPQAYQTGLGPSDLILGLRGAWGAWQGGLAWQRAGSRSGNVLTRLKRGDDALLWLGHTFAWEDTRLVLKGLALQRLGRSTVTDAQGRFVEVAGSDRLQVNLEAILVHPLARGLDLQAGAAFPFLKRPSNVDGLKRSWTASLGLAWSF